MTHIHLIVTYLDGEERWFSIGDDQEFYTWFVSDQCGAQVLIAKRRPDIPDRVHIPLALVRHFEIKEHREQDVVPAADEQRIPATEPEAEPRVSGDRGGGVSRADALAGVARGLEILRDVGISVRDLRQPAGAKGEQPVAPEGINLTDGEPIATLCREDTTHDWQPGYVKNSSFFLAPTGLFERCSRCLCVRERR